jgi:hypothetical protein
LSEGKIVAALRAEGNERFLKKPSLSSLGNAKREGCCLRYPGEKSEIAAPN